MISDSGEIIPGASDLGNLSPLQSQGSLFNPLGLDLLDESAAPGRSREASLAAAVPSSDASRERSASNLVFKEVWDQLASSSSAGVPGSMASQGTALQSQSSQLASAASAGGQPEFAVPQALDRVAHLSDNPRLSQSELVAERHKRNRAMASLSSINSDLVDSALPSAEDLAAAVDSMELNFFTGPGEGGRPRAISGGGAGANPNASVASVPSICSDDMNAFLQNPQLSLGGSASSSAPNPMAQVASELGMAPLPEDHAIPGRAVVDRSSCATNRSSYAADPDGRQSRARSSSDQSRPLWRGILKHIEELEMALSVASQSVLQKQRILASFYEVLVPKLQALGQVGTLAQQRLAMLMADAGVMEGTPTPASEDELNMVVGQAVAALKRYVTSSMMAPMVAPRSSSAGAPLPPGAPPHFVLPNPSTPQPPPEGSAEAAAAAAAAKLHACKNCQKAKTACMDQRPCQRCVRLGIPCDDDQKKVKRACGSCKRAKVKCDLDDKPLGVSCGRCTRLNLPCTPHVPNKKKRTGAAASDAADALLGDVADAIGLEPLEASGPLGGGPAGGFGEGLGFDMGGGGDAPLGSLEEVCDQLLKDSGSLPSGTFADPAALALDPDAIGVTRMSASEMLPQRLSLNSEGLPVGRSRDASMAGLSDIIKGSGMSGAGSLSASVLGSLSGIAGGGLGSASASFSGVPLPPEEERPGASPCAPLLPFDEVMKTERWSGVVHELNARVLQTRLERRTLWLATTDVPAPPAVVAAGYRQLLRTWGTNDPLVCQITELSHGGGPEEPVAHCSVCFEQIVHMHCKPPWPYEPRDFVLRSVWAISNGAYAGCLRPTTEPLAPVRQGIRRSNLSVDIWINPNLKEPGSSSLYVVVEPSDDDATLVSSKPHRLLAWVRRVQESAIRIQRDDVSRGVA